VSALAPAGGWQPQLLDTGTIPMRATLLAPAGALGAQMIDLPANVLLLRGEGGTVLVDAGSGPLTDEWPGAVSDLAGALAAAGCAPAQIDLVVLTHLDYDHCGGCLELGDVRLAVPAAAADAASGRIGDRLARARGRGLLQLLDDGDSAAAGIVVRDAPGHRVGHSLVEVGGSLVHVSDVIHHPSHVEHPTWDRAFDFDEALALTTRRELLDELADRDVTVVATHIAEPGRIERSPQGLQWQTV
jgi:glyoxylase-like metal-dependent hydrolase (beta-lactamase superfamily II)